MTTCMSMCRTRQRWGSGRDSWPRDSSCEPGGGTDAVQWVSCGRLDWTRTIRVQSLRSASRIDPRGCFGIPMNAAAARRASTPAPPGQIRKPCGTNQGQVTLACAAKSLAENNKTAGNLLFSCVISAKNRSSQGEAASRDRPARMGFVAIDSPPGSAGSARASSTR